MGERAWRAGRIPRCRGLTSGLTPRRSPSRYSPPWPNPSRPGSDTGADPEAIAEQVFAALADPSRRAILAALASGGPATATDLAGRLPITRHASAKHPAPPVAACPV